MISNRKLLISALLVATAGAGAVYLYQRYRGPAESVRLLPEGDLLIYVNFRPIHLWDVNKSKPVQRESEYQEFVAQTGIQFERDLDEVAMSRRDTGDGRDVESAEIFVGRFDAARLKNYLQKISSQTETYRDQTIFTVVNEEHTVRVCILDATRLAVTH